MKKNNRIQFDDALFYFAAIFGTAVIVLRLFLLIANI